MFTRKRERSFPDAKRGKQVVEHALVVGAPTDFAAGIERGFAQGARLGLFSGRRLFARNDFKVEKNDLFFRLPP